MNQYVSQGVFDRRVKLIEEKLKNIYDNDLLNRLQAEQEEFIKRLKEIELDGSIPDYFIADYNAFKANTLRIDSAFDSDGQFDGSRIQPNTVSTAALTVGQRSQQLSLTGVEFSVTPYSHSGGYYGTLGWSGGSMFHYGFINENSEPKVYTITSGSFALGNSAYYIYAYIANLESTTTTSEIKVSTNQIKVDGEGKPNDFPNGYYVQLGYVSVELDSGSSESSNRYYRKVDTTYGQTTINGRLITTGRIEGSNGANYVYFDLDKGEIGGTIKFTSGNEELDIDDYLETKYTDIYEYVLGDSTTGIQKIINDVRDELEGQIDGRIDTWFGNVQPGPNVYPENEWTTTSDKDNHLGDLYYDDSTGYAYRYTKNGNNYTWNKIEDTDMTRALAIAKSAKETADGKMSVFLDDPSNPPIPPYSEGDMWVNATYPKTGTKIYNDETLVCIDRHFESCANASYSQSTIYYKIENNEYVVDDEVTSENFNTKKSSLYKQIFNIADWQSSNRAIAEVDNVTNDGIISKGSEKASLKKEFEEITGTYNKALAAINTFDVGSNVTTQKTALDNAYNALLAKMKVILGTNTQGNIDDSRINEDTEIESAIAPGLNMTKQAFRDLWTTYYSAEATLNDAIQKAAQDKIEAGVDAAKSELLAIENGTTTIAGGMITNNLLELKNIVGVTKQFKNFVEGRSYYKRISNKTVNNNVIKRFLEVTISGTTYPDYNLYEIAQQGDINTINGIIVQNESATTGTSATFKATEFHYGGGEPGFVTAGLSGIEDFPCYWSGGDEVLARDYIRFKKAWLAAPNTTTGSSYINYVWRNSDLDFIYDWTESTGQGIGTYPIWKKNSSGDVLKANFATSIVRYYIYKREGTRFVTSYDTTPIDTDNDIPRLPVVIIDFDGFCKFGEFCIYNGQAYYNNASGFGHYALTLNGQQNGSGTSLGSFYAPTSAGTNGYILKSNGSGAPSWVAQSNLSVGSATTATKLGTSSFGNQIKPFYLNAGVPTACDIYRYHYDSTSDYASYAWHKVAYVAASATTDRVITLLVTKGNSVTTNGILKCRVRWDANSAFNSDNTKLNWVVNNGIDVNDFVFVWESPNVELWCKMTERYGGYHFTVLDSGNRAGNGILTWTLCDSVSGHGSASYTTGGTVITSSVATLINNITGTVNGYSISSTVNSGTANRLAYYTSSGIDDASTTYVSNTKLAINSTSEPSYNFYVYGTADITTSALINNITIGENTISSGSTLYLDSAAGSSLIFRNGTTEMGRWNSNSNLIVGKPSSPNNITNKLYVNGTSYFDNSLNINSAINTWAFHVYNKNASATTPFASCYIANGNTGSGMWLGTSVNSSSYYIANFRYGATGDGAGGTSALYVRADGNVGVGTESPECKLHAKVSSSSGCEIKTENSNGAISLYTATNRGIYDRTTSTWLIATNGTDSWLSRGNVGIGTTTPPVKLSVSGDIYASGGVTALQTVTSDKRFKKNIKKFEAKEIINKLQPVEFEWNNKAKKYSDTFKDGKNFGLIAQDSDGIIDNLVFDLPDGKGYKGVRYEKLIPILLQAVKEQQKEIDELKSIVKQLKNK